MSFLLDTNVIRQLTKPAPSVNVLRWLGSISESDLMVSAITIRELLYGVEKAKREKGELVQVFSERIEAVISSYGERVLPIDSRVARVWASMLARSNKHLDDTGIAATAAVHGLTLVTRNIDQVRTRGVPLLDPFTHPARLFLRTAG